MQPNETDLEAAERAGDATTLVRIYTSEAGRLEAAGDIDAACFFLTHAYIWALEGGLQEAADLRARLVGHGREA